MFGKIKIQAGSIVLFILLLALNSCNNNPANGQRKNTDSLSRKLNDISIPGNFSSQAIIKFDSTELKKFLVKHPLFKGFSTDLGQFYSNRNFTYAWFDHSGLIEQASNLFNRLENIHEEGLKISIPYQREFEHLMDSLAESAESSSPDITTELMLTSQYFFYARKVWQGITEKETKNIEWLLPRKKLNLQQAMDSLLHDSNPSFVSQEPVYPQYNLLKSWLQKYHQLENEKWPYIKADKKSYKPGDSSAVIASIRHRLYLLGDISADSKDSHYDAELEAGVKKFQVRHGLHTDAVMGPGFMQQLNVPIDHRLEQIMVNMERCRWVPYELKTDHLVVNIPAFKLYAFEKDSVVWEMNVVVGKALNKTVIFNGNLKYVVFSPYWNVPNSILQKEILPAIRRNKNYLKQNNMEWSGNNVRQKPGPDNSLGRVKFLFPNSFNIYLHDTPAKGLFDLEQRAFSHGCIRVAEAKKLAMYLLRNDPEWDENKIDEAMNAGQEKYVTLKKEVPVFIAYFTSWVDRNGHLNFRNDIYKRDQKLAELMFK